MQSDSYDNRIEQDIAKCKQDLSGDCRAAEQTTTVAKIKIFFACYACL